jgi:hypothetical protein
VPRPGNLIRIPVSFDDAISAALKVKPESKKPKKKPAAKKRTR